MTDHPDYRFSKSERLCSKKLIEQLYTQGNRLMTFPYSVHWTIQKDLPFPAQVIVVAPKRRFHHAVDRNRVKRLTRECYRLHKPQLYQFLQEHDVQIALSLSYVHTEIMDYQVLYHKFDKLIAQLQKSIIQERQ